MTKNPLKDLAERIWAYGESRITAAECLIPAWRADNHHQEIIDIYNATHYDIRWKEKGKSVEVRFYNAGAYGAVMNVGKAIEKIVIDLFPSKEKDEIPTTLTKGKKYWRGGKE